MKTPDTVPAAVRVGFDPRVALAPAARPGAARALAEARPYGSHGVSSAQAARSRVAHDVAWSYIGGRLPDPVDVEACRLLFDVAFRAERYMDARLRAGRAQRLS